MRRTRLVEAADAPVLADLVIRNREFLARYEPLREADYFTEQHQRSLVEDQLVRHAEGRLLPHVILDDSGSVVGRITLSDTVRGPFQSSNLGYWVAQDAGGRGLAQSAVQEVARLAFEELGLHRLQAGTLVDNVRSQRVLERTGFVRYGLAPRYLRIDGRWQDHILFQRIAPAPG